MAATDGPILDDPQLEGAADKLSATDAGDDGPFTKEGVAEVVHEAAEELQDAPVKVLVPLLAENKARDRLHEQREARDSADKAS